ncbi:MAG: hypothetical protein ACYTGH_02705 [Planctomycetota bacterium]|jgi:type II secretory pathway pseudopilin PulG
MSNPEYTKKFPFTMIELMVTMAIIVMLMGMTLGLIGMAKDASYRNRTTALMQYINMALESFKEDNGAYPACTIPLSIADTDSAKIDMQMGSEALYNSLYNSGGYLKKQGTGENLIIKYPGAFVDTTNSYLMDAWEQPLIYLFWTSGTPTNIKLRKGFESSYALWSIGSDGEYEVNMDATAEDDVDADNIASRRMTTETN